MMLSKRCIYGIKASIYLALTAKPDKYVSIQKMAEELNLSFYFMTKVLQVLTREGIMHSLKGPNGGIALARPPEELNILEIVCAIDGSKCFTQCILGFPGCGKRKSCALHDKWVVIREKIKTGFSQMSVADLAARTEKLNLRLVEEVDIS